MFSFIRQSGTNHTIWLDNPLGHYNENDITKNGIAKPQSGAIYTDCEIPFLTNSKYALGMSNVYMFIRYIKSVCFACYISILLLLSVMLSI